MARENGGVHPVAGARLARIAAAAICFTCGLTAAWAEGTAIPSSSYITPFPQTDRYQLRVLGDWLGTGLNAGLQEAFKNDGSLQITDASRSNYGLLRAEQLDLYGEVDRMLAATPPVNIAVIFLGVNDRGSFRSGTGRSQPGSEEWKETYGKEAEKLIKKLRSANVAVYWVGLPAMANPALNEFAGAVNDAVRQAAYLNGAKFIETAAGFTDQLGGYSAYGPDVTGQTKRLREGDGIGLTPVGNRKLANYVEIALRRDLAQARAQRNIPLAGDEEEQARVVPPRAAAAAKPAVTSDAATPKAASPKAEAPAFKTELLPAPQAQETLRRDQAAFAAGGGPQGEFILGDLGDALTSVAVISPVNDLSMREIQRQTPLADRLYFKVLSKGEALPAKEGRADDFRWRGDAAPQPQ
jgi:hypothetical protein